MERARAAGIAVPEHQIVVDRFPAPPLMAYPSNPFTLTGVLLLDDATIEARRKGLTYTGKYAVLAQTLPPDYRIDLLKVAPGRAPVAQHVAFAASPLNAFLPPLMRVRVTV